MSKEPKSLAKMTLKAICGLTRQDDAKTYMAKLAADGTEIAVIAGELTGYGGKSGQYGENFFLLGTFVAQNRMNGDLFRASKAYLPKNVTESLIESFKSRATAEDAIKFQLSVSVIEDRSSAVGYAYVCEPARTPEVVNKEAQLLASFAALPAPKAVKAIGGKK